jgi:hypothetical protein
MANAYRRNGIFIDPEMRGASMHMMKPSALRENCCVPLFFSEKLLAPMSALAGSGRGAILRSLGQRLAIVTDKTAVISDDSITTASSMLSRLLDQPRSTSTNISTCAISSERLGSRRRNAAVRSACHAPLDRIMTLVRPFDASFAEHVILVVDDSHGVGVHRCVTGRIEIA